jgi:heme exporter protein D
MLDLDMSPYAAFVWPAWGLSALVLTALVARAVVASRRWKAELKRLEPSLQVAQGSVGSEARPQAAQGAVGPQK